MGIEFKHDAGIGIVTINRPEALNALSAGVLEELRHVLEEVSNDERTRVVVLTGAGERAFVAGADIAEMVCKTPEEANTFARAGQKLFARLQELPQPTIAAVNGFALGGGCELALACDLRIAAENAKLGLPEVSLGIIPGFGGTQRLPRIIGRAKALELILTARIVDAQEALTLGLLNQVVPGDQLLNRAMEMATTIAAKGPHAIRQAKLAVNDGLGNPLEHGCELEAELFGQCFAGWEQKEGMRAFLEKRKPDFLKGS